MRSAQFYLIRSQLDFENPGQTQFVICLARKQEFFCLKNLELSTFYICFYFTLWFFRVRAKGKGKNKGNGRQKEKEGLEEEKALLWQPKVLSIVKFLTGDVK